LNKLGFSIHFGKTVSQNRIQAFDIADHFCEFAGVNGQHMDYANLYPDKVCLLWIFIWAGKFFDNYGLE
jgi:hypothetical protein